MAQDWFYGRSGRSQGPVSWEELKERAAAGEVARTDLVWTTGWAEWRAAGEVAGLWTAPAPKVAAAPVPAVVPPPPPPTLPEPEEEEEEEVRTPGLPLSLLLGIAGACAAAGMLIAGIVLFVVLRPGPATESGSYQVLLAPGQIDKRVVIFRGRRQAEVRVTTEGQGGEANVDLEIRSEDGMRVEAADPGPGGNCQVRLLPGRTERFEIRVINHGPAPARCTVSHQ